MMVFPATAHLIRISHCDFFVIRISIGASPVLPPVFATAKPFASGTNPSVAGPVAGSSFTRHEDAKRSAHETDSTGQFTDQFPVDFDRDGLIAFHTQSAGLEIFISGTRMSELNTTSWRYLITRDSRAGLKTITSNDPFVDHRVF